MTEDDAARLAWADTEMDRLTLAELHKVVPEGHRDARFVRQLRHIDLQFISAEDRQLLRDLAWRWRRQLPRTIAPKLPPHDPLVKAMEASRV